MKRLILIIISLGILTQMLTADTDRKEVMMKQARRYSAQRDYEKANEIYLQLNREFPDDYKITENLILNYISAKRFNDAEQSLEYNEGSLPDEIKTNLELRIFLAQSKYKKAEKAADNFLADNKGRIQIYRKVSQVFEYYRQYEKSVEILLQARKQANDEKLFSRELALDYEYLKDYPNSITELISYLENNKGYFYFVKSRVKNMLKDNPEMIDVVRDRTALYNDEKIKEIYGFALAEVKNYSEALTVYEELPRASLRNFAINMQKIGEYEIALEALQIYIADSGEAHLEADVKIEIARIHLEKGEFEQAKIELLEIYNNEKLQNKKLRYKTKANKLCRQMLAQIAMIQKEDDKVVLSYLKDALGKSFNKRDKDEIKFEIIDFEINRGNFETAENSVLEIQKNDDPSSDSYKTSNYYGFMISLMRGEAKADTLLSELLVTMPESELTNNALQLAVVAGGMDKTASDALFEAYRKFNLMQIEEAVALLLKYNEENPNEEIYYLAGEWAALAGNFELARTIFSHDFSGKVLGDYAKLKQVELLTDEEERTVLIRNFLTDKHQSVFAPSFRILMEN